MPGPSSPLLLRRRPAGGSGRWLLLGAVLIGLLALQFLSGHDAAGHHRLLISPPAAAALQAQPQVAPVPTVSASIDQPSEHGHAIVAGCCLLLLAAGVVALAQAVRRRTSGRRPTKWSILAGGLRAPPLSLSRQALCVERI